MGDIKLEVENRSGRGRHTRNQLAKNGKIPGVVYGKEMGSMAVAVDSGEIQKIVRNFGTSKLIDLDVKGNNDEKIKVMVKDLQYDPLRRDVTHVDFQKINMEDEIKTSVRVKLLGDPVGVQEGGVLQQQLRTVEIECLPGDIPESITADISSLRLGSSLQVTDLNLPQGVRIAIDPDTVVASVTVPRVAAEEVEPEEAKEYDAEGDAAKESPKGENNKDQGEA